jgi:hypothetical protein
MAPILRRAPLGGESKWAFSAFVISFAADTPLLVLSAMIRARPRHPRSIDAFFGANTNC